MQFSIEIIIKFKAIFLHPPLIYDATIKSLTDRNIMKIDEYIKIYIFRKYRNF